MNTLLIREAMHSDTPAIEDLCRAIDPKDYVPQAWSDWMSRGDTINLVATMANRVVGCAHGRILVLSDAWSQAVRVLPEMQRSGIGLRLMDSIEKALLRRGATAVFGNIGTFNGPSLAFFTRQNWHPVCTIKRRTATHRIGLPAESIPVTRGEIFKLVTKFPVLASMEKPAYFKRVYFTMNEEYLEKAISSQSVRIAPGRDAVAFLDPREGDTKRLWVTALAGSNKGMKQLIEAFIGEASSLGSELIVDSPDIPEIQAFLDAYSFEPPPKTGAYHVVKKELSQ
jgi:N-acetylglutamate synthase-like GNAT family acetyltransferase